MKKPKFSLAHKDEEMRYLVEKTDQKTLATWAIDCAKRVLPYFEEKFSTDKRPQIALEILKNWVDTGEFHMAIIRKASLDAHKAAKEIGNDNPASSVAHACGQAVATAHVPIHSLGSAIYSQQAIFRITNSFEAIKNERDWQYKHLIELNKYAK